MSHNDDPGKLTLWLLDTRKLWPGSKVTIEHPASSHRLTPPKTAPELSLISASERAAVSRKFHAADARMTLASSLLKRLYISRALDLPWSEVRVARRGDAKHGKPAAQERDGSFVAGIDFNVSHQGGVVVLVGYRTGRAGARGGREFRAGIDVTLVNERDDWRVIDAEGFDGWTATFADVFSDAEMHDMTYNVADDIVLEDGKAMPAASLTSAVKACLRRGEMFVARVNHDGPDHRLDSSRILEAKLRRFYAFFAYREAYVKMTGDALLAKWLKDLEFRNVVSPRPPHSPHTEGGQSDAWGEKLSGAEAHLFGKKVDDLQVDITAFEDGYMIACAVQGLGDLQLSEHKFQALDLEKDIIPYSAPTEWTVAAEETK